MAKVIGFNSKVSKQVTCRSCSAVVEYVPNEVQKKKSYDYTGSWDWYKSVSCPNCGKDISV